MNIGIAIGSDVEGIAALEATLCIARLLPQNCAVFVWEPPATDVFRPARQRIEALRGTHLHAEYPERDSVKGLDLSSLLVFGRKGLKRVLASAVRYKVPILRYRAEVVGKLDPDSEVTQ